MNKVLRFPSVLHTGTGPITETIATSEQFILPAIANRLTIGLIQQALDDACTSKDWKSTKRKIDAAIKRGHMHTVK